jgi:hypothetical protein
MRLQGPAILTCHVQRELLTDPRRQDESKEEGGMGRNPNGTVPNSQMTASGRMYS